MGEIRVERHPGRTDHVFVNLHELEPETHWEEKTAGRKGRRAVKDKSQSAPTRRHTPRLLAGDEPRVTTRNEGEAVGLAVAPPAATATSSDCSTALTHDDLVMLGSVADEPKSALRDLGPYELL